MTTPPASPDTPAEPSEPTEPGSVTTTYGKPKKSRGRRILKWTSISLAVIIVIAVGGAYADYRYINGKITIDPRVLPSGVTPPPVLKDATKAENFLLIGSDSRAGANGKGTGGADIQGARSDTTIIMHISANNAGATLISIPRDSYVQIPSCVNGPHGQLSQPEMSKFNAAFSLGGEYDAKYAPSCTEHAIETLTGINITHYAVVDFTGFTKMVDALGGVKMCVAHPLVDPIVDDDGAYHGSGLNLPQGKDVEIDGTQALALMRARYALDGGGDLPRIKRQQEFIAAMLRKATSSGLLTHPFKLQHFLTAAASSLTTDGFGLGTMKKLASALHSAGAGKVRLLTVPTVSGAPGVPSADVLWDPTKAPALWNAIKNDQPIPGTKTKAKAKTTPSPTPTPTISEPALSEPTSDITVNILNGTSQDNLASTVASDLEAQGFHIGTTGDADKETYKKSVVEYGPDKIQSSQTLAESVPGSVRRANSGDDTTLTLIVGSNFNDVVPVTLGSASASASSTPTPTPSISSISAASTGCLS